MLKQSVSSNLSIAQDPLEYEFNAPIDAIAGVVSVLFASGIFWYLFGTFWYFLVLFGTVCYFSVHFGGTFFRIPRIF